IAKKAAKPVAKPAAKAAKPVAKKATPAPVLKTPVKKNEIKAKPVAQKTVKPTTTPVSKQEVKKSAVKSAPVKVAPKKVVTQPIKSTEFPKNFQPPQPKPFIKNPVTKMEENNEPQMRYSDEDLKEFKELIDKKLLAAREELKNLKESLDNHTESQAGNKAWNMEEGTDTSEMEYLMNQISRQHQYIRNLELALVRIENKTYGICRVSGRLIPKERLRVVPHATMSLESKMSRKSDETSPGAAVAGTPPTDFAEGFED
ncbi:MAG: hypothetical protein JST49_02280, partial [Bacteroidetes bacterium]|nr:hypothetical protein [Bacteroidota bacterium]